MTFFRTSTVYFQCIDSEATNHHPSLKRCRRDQVSSFSRILQWQNGIVRRSGSRVVLQLLLSSSSSSVRQPTNEQHERVGVDELICRRHYYRLMCCYVFGVTLPLLVFVVYSCIERKEKNFYRKFVEWKRKCSFVESVCIVGSMERVSCLSTKDVGFWLCKFSLDSSVFYGILQLVRRRCRIENYLNENMYLVDVMRLE